MKELQSVSELKYIKELSQACEEHEYFGSKCLRLHEEIEKYIECVKTKGENLDFCYKFTEKIIINLIIDDSFKEKHQIRY